MTQIRKDNLMKLIETFAGLDNQIRRIQEERN